MVLKHINSPMTPDYMKYLLEHDTVHGRFSGTCEIKGDGLLINGMDVSLSATRDPTEIPWAKTGVEYVCESTGAFTTTEGRRQGLPDHEGQADRHGFPRAVRRRVRCRPDLRAGDSLHLRRVQGRD